MWCRGAALQLLPIATSRMVVDTERATDLDDLLGRMADRDDDYRYSVAWIDLLATGRQLGRGGADPRRPRAGGRRCRGRQRAARLDFDPRELVAAPPWVPGGLLNAWTVRAFNEAWYRKAPAHAHR